MVYSHSIVAKQESVNSMSRLVSGLIYSIVRKIIPKPELTWNSELSSTIARDSGE